MTLAGHWQRVDCTARQVMAGHRNIVQYLKLAPYYGIVTSSREGCTIRRVVQRDCTVFGGV